jgi:hypothetical protein
VTLLRKPLYRFLLWAGIVIVVAAATGFAGLAWWLIVAIVFCVWVVLTVVERRLDRASTPREAAPEATAAVPAPEPIVAAAPAAVDAPEPVRRRRFLPTAAARPEPGPAPTAVVAHGEKQWSIWALDKVARENTNTDAELRFLVLSLQEYADADGLLPLQFDPLVRESFGELLGIATV